jgi:hypothetical protein
LHDAANHPSAKIVRFAITDFQQAFEATQTLLDNLDEGHVALRSCINATMVLQNLARHSAGRPGA